MPRLAVDADYAAEVGAQLMEQGLPGVAASALAKASESGLGPEALTGYGLAMGGLGMIGEAFEALQSADMLAPTAVSHARMIGLHTFVRDLAVGRVREAHAWAERYAAYSLDSALSCFKAVRNWNTRLLTTISEEDRHRPTTDPERGTVIFWTLIEIMAGHDLFRLQQIERRIAQI